MLHGLIQVYTGNGKGKTTAAIGQGIRSMGRGLTIFMIQFLKTSDSGELHSIEKLGEKFRIFRFEKPRGFFWNLSDEQKIELKNEVHEAFSFARKVAQEKECNVMILDEIMGVINNGLIDEKEVCEFLRSKPKEMEIILTGRNMPESIGILADYISEINAVKHPMQKGIQARVGIEY